MPRSNGRACFFFGCFKVLCSKCLGLVGRLCRGCRLDVEAGRWTEQKRFEVLRDLAQSYDSPREGIPILAQAKAWGSSDSFSGRFVIRPGYGHRGHCLRAVVGDWLSHYFVLKAMKLAIQCGIRRGFPSRRRTREEQKASCSIYLGRRCSTAAIPYLGNS